MLEKYKVKLATIDAPNDVAKFNLDEDSHLLCRLNNGAMWVSPEQLPGKAGYVVGAGQIVPDDILTEGRRGETFPITFYRFADDRQNQLTARVAKGMPLKALTKLLMMMHDEHPEATVEEAMGWVTAQLSNVVGKELKALDASMSGDVSLAEKAERIAEAKQDGFGVVRFFTLDRVAADIWDDMRDWRK